MGEGETSTASQNEKWPRLLHNSNANEEHSLKLAVRGLVPGAWPSRAWQSNEGDGIQLGDVRGDWFLWISWSVTFVSFRHFYPDFPSEKMSKVAYKRTETTKDFQKIFQKMRVSPQNLLIWWDHYSHFSTSCPSTAVKELVWFSRAL